MAADRLSFILLGPARLSLERLKGIRSVWRSWQEWAANQSSSEPSDRISLYAPSAVQLARHLRHEAARGPTVPPARLSAFRWLREYIGVPLPVEARLVRDFGNVPPDYRPEPATALNPEEFWNMVALAQRLEPSKAHLVHLVL